MRQSCQIKHINQVNITDVLQLPIAERIRLVGTIQDSISEIPEAVELTDAQKAELDGRPNAVAMNSDEGSSWAEVRARL